MDNKELQQLREASARLIKEKCSSPEKAREYLISLGLDLDAEPVDTTGWFNYCVGHYWDNGDGAIGTTYHSEVFFGPMSAAEEFLEYVKRQSPDEDWKIFKVVPI